MAAGRRLPATVPAMPIKFSAVRSFGKSTGVVVRIVTADATAAGLDGVDPKQLRRAGFTAKPNSVHVWPAEGRDEALVGIGDAAKAASAGSAAFRKAGAVIARKLRHHRRIGIELPTDIVAAPGLARQSLVEGLALASYSFDAYKSEPDDPALSYVDIGGGSSAANRAAIERGEVLAGAQMFARDLVNEPGGTLTPEAFAERLEAMAADKELGITIWDADDIAEGGLGGLAGVNRGSDRPARLVEISYYPDPALGRASGRGPAQAGADDTDEGSGDPCEPLPMLALVGKGVTFDAGGLSIKTGQGMMTMKYDMAGAAAVAGAMSALGALGVRCRVLAFIPMTDNMLGGDATRPGDVLRIRNGKTIEVLNTDAEGRLILADALSLACEAGPDAIVDAATLTGACVVALGPKIAGLMGNNGAWLDQIRSASAASGEAVWHLPLPAEYKEHIRSAVADMQNIGKPQGGALTAGLILQEFVDESIPWAHLDIAGPAFSESAEAEIVKGGTGFGVRLLAHLAENFEVPAA